MVSFNSIASFVVSSAKTTASSLGASLSAAVVASPAKNQTGIAAAFSPAALTKATLTPLTNAIESGTVIRGTETLFGGKSALWKNLFEHFGDSVKIVEPSIAGKFHTQAGAANYIADNSNSSGNGARADKLVQDAVRDACNRWKPGMDLQAMIKDSVKKALTGVLPDSVPPTGGFRGPKTPDEVANQVASYVHANGNDPISAAEKMVYNDRHPAPGPR